MTFKQFILLGLPGVGVRDQAMLLAERWNLPHLSLDQLKHQAVTQKSSLGAELGPHMETNAPLPDGLALKLVRKRLEQPDAMLQGWVLDGFPCTLVQAQGLADWLAAVGQPGPTVVYLKAMTGLLMNRLWNQSGQKESTAAIRQRLDQHQEQLDPLLAYYQQENLLKTINGSLSFAEVGRELAQLGHDTAGAAGWIRDEAELDALLAQEPLLVVDCMASWCGSCKQVTPLIDQLAETYRHQVNVMKMDFDANRQISKRFGLKGIPAVMVFKDGELQETLTGVKSYQDYQNTLVRFLASPAP